MINLLYSAFMTSIIYLLDRSKRQKPYMYAIYFLFFFLSYFYCFTLRADTIDTFQQEIMEKIFFDELQSNIEIFTGQEAWTGKEQNQYHKSISYYVDKRNEHRRLAKKYMKKATNLKVLFPDVDERDRAKQCISAGIALIASSNGFARVIAAIYSLIAMEGLFAYDSFRDFQHYLHVAEYHSNMYEFYRDAVEIQKAVKIKMDERDRRLDLIEQDRDIIKINPSRGCEEDFSECIKHFKGP